MLLIRRFLVLALLPSVSACNSQPPSANQPPVPAVREESASCQTAFDRGAQYLLSRQSEDGAWRSDVYGHFKHGDALTPLVIVALQQAPESNEMNAAIDRGIQWLMRYVVARKGLKESFVIDGELQYPVYTASLTIIALSDPRQKQHLSIRDAWVRYLLSLQFTGENGWTNSDWQTGGWGYAAMAPVKPKEGPIPPALEANLSATAYALTALQQAGIPHDHAAFAGAAAFVLRCRNPNGSFFFTPGDPFRNKAGATAEPGGTVRYRGYGSASADGIRCLRALGRTGRELEQTRQWLHKQFPPDGPFFHHGDFAADREKDRDAAFFYYAAGICAELGDGPRRKSLADVLIDRQKEDGSWRNDLNTVREDDPVVATSLALMALRWKSGME